MIGAGNVRGGRTMRSAGSDRGAGGMDTSASSVLCHSSTCGVGGASSMIGTGKV